MKKRHILCLSRAECFSPNSVERDKEIFSGVCNLLELNECRVTKCSEDSLPTLITHYEETDRPDLVLTMARHSTVLEILALWEEQGTPIINSPKALLNTSRLLFYNLMKDAGVPWVETYSIPPTSKILMGDEDGNVPCPYPFWLKRDDAKSEVAQDVVFVCDKKSWYEAMKDFSERNIQQVVATPHIKGDLIKFYGVADTDFFFYYYPTKDNDFSKFNLELHNGAPNGYLIDKDMLHKIANQAAKCTDISVYGGDAVLTATGEIFIIDFNDFPSFSKCKDDAARAIAQKVLSTISS